MAKKSSLLETRLKKINRMLDDGEITEKTYDVLDAVARNEAGILDWDELFIELTQ